MNNMQIKQLLLDSSKESNLNPSKKDIISKDTNHSNQPVKLNLINKTQIPVVPHPPKMQVKTINKNS